MVGEYPFTLATIGNPGGIDVPDLTPIVNALVPLGTYGAKHAKELGGIVYKHGKKFTKTVYKDLTRAAREGIYQHARNYFMPTTVKPATSSRLIFPVTQAGSFRKSYRRGSSRFSRYPSRYSKARTFRSKLRYRRRYRRYIRRY